MTGVCVCVTGVLCVLLCVSVCLCDRCVGVRGLCVCVTGVLCVPHGVWHASLLCPF